MIGTSLVATTRLRRGPRSPASCGSGIIEVIAELFLAGMLTSDGVIDGSLAARTPRVVADGRTFSYVLHDGAPRLVITQNDVRQIQLAKAALLRRVPTADGPPRDRDRRPHPARRRVRRAHRSGPRHGARPRSRLRPRARDDRRQRGRHRCPHRAAEPGRARRDRGGRPPRREDRDGRRAALPGALRRRHGDPARDRPVPAAGAPWSPSPSGGPPPVGRSASTPPARPITERSTHERRRQPRPEAPRRRRAGPGGRASMPWRREDPVHHPDSDALRGAERGGPRPSSTTPTRSWSRWASSSTSAGRAGAVEGRRRRGRWRARPVPWGLARARAGDGAPRVQAVRAQPREQACASAATNGVRPRYGSPFVRDLDRGVGTARSRTSGTS